MKLTPPKSKKISGIEDYFDVNILIDDEYFDKVNKFVLTKENNNFLLIPMTDIDNIKILKIKNLNDRQYDDKLDRILSGQEAIDLVNHLFTNNQLQISHFELNLNKLNAKQIEFETKSN